AVARTGFIEPPLSSRIRNGRDRLQRDPVAIACPDPSTERVMVALIAGQSNASNSGEPFTEPDDPRILNLLDGRCYIARHPLLGATFPGSSPWLAMARHLIEQGVADKV